VSPFARCARIVLLIAFWMGTETPDEVGIIRACQSGTACVMDDMYGYDGTQSEGEWVRRAGEAAQRDCSGLVDEAGLPGRSPLVQTGQSA